MLKMVLICLRKTSNNSTWARADGNSFPVNHKACKLAIDTNLVEINELLLSAFQEQSTLVIPWYRNISKILDK